MGDSNAPYRFCAASIFKVLQDETAIIEALWQVTENLVARISDQNVVFDPNPEVPIIINTGFHGDNHAAFEYFLANR